MSLRSYSPTHLLSLRFSKPSHPSTLPAPQPTNSPQHVYPKEAPPRRHPALGPHDAHESHSARSEPYGDNVCVSFLTLAFPFSIHFLPSFRTFNCLRLLSPQPCSQPSNNSASIPATGQTCGRIRKRISRSGRRLCGRNIPAKASRGGGGSWMLCWEGLM